MVTYVYRDGSRLTPYMLYQIERLNAWFGSVTGLRILVTSGIRLHQEQIAIFLDRYRIASQVNGRRVYDTRRWNGVMYYRISSAGTVAPPGFSNHEIQGNNAAVDIRDSGSDPGISSWGSSRSAMVAKAAPNFDMDWEGRFFKEAWHYKVKNIFSAVPASASAVKTSFKKGPTVIPYRREDKTARASGRKLQPGGNFWLNTLLNAPVSKATNIVGAVGYYTITLHVYATGTPGDVLEAQLFWDDTKTNGPHSGHYVERLTFDSSGQIKASFTTQRSVQSGYAVYANLRSDKSNKSIATVSVFDTDACLIN